MVTGTGSYTNDIFSEKWTRGKNAAHLTSSASEKITGSEERRKEPMHAPM